ncbi:MAG TPA: phosphotransferase [Planctomycetota bacterium]|nr:phosphotransferase [Planctomycetota bacterium]
MAELVRGCLLRPGAPELEAVEWTYARWKPRTALSAGYELRFADGGERRLHVKRYAGDKAQWLAARGRAGSSREDDRLLHADLVRAEEGLVASVFPTDRVLPGLERLLNLRRTARWTTGCGVYDGARMRARHSSAQLLRYRPESRAVFKLSAGWTSADGRRGTTCLAARVLPPARAARVAALREACPFAGSPRLLAVQARTGLLVEEWLEVRPQSPDAFDHAELAGELLASLHALPGASGAAPIEAPAEGRRRLDALFAWHPELAALAAALDDATPEAPPVWSHGDFHPDQVALEPGGRGVRLLDLDRLGPAAAAADLASWTADRLAHAPDLGLEDASAPLLAGYSAGGGRPPPTRELAAHVVSQLRARAAASLRRLELGGETHAARLLGLAHEIRERAARPARVRR